MATLTNTKSQKLRKNFASNAFESLYSRKVAETKSEHSSIGITKKNVKLTLILPISKTKLKLNFNRHRLVFGEAKTLQRKVTVRFSPFTAALNVPVRKNEVYSKV